MKIIVLLVLCLIPVISKAQSDSCIQAASSYWDSKLAQSGAALGQKIVSSSPKPLSIFDPEFTIWKLNIIDSATTLDVTFAMNGNNSFTSLAQSLLYELQQGAQLPAAIEALPNLKFSVSDDFDKLDKVDLIRSSQTTIGTTLNTSAHEKNCQSVMMCRSDRAGACQLYVDSWVKAVNSYKDPASQLAPKKMAELAIEYGNDWNKYFNESRSQTIIDRSFTAWRNSEKLRSNAFQKAPDLQYFLFHPSVVMEYVDGAQDGEQFAAALSVEWLGINNWRGCNLGFVKVPCGISAISIFSDKASTTDTGYGLMLHINNAYSFGVVDRDGETGAFLNVDLLKAFESKEKEVSAWKEKVDQYLK